MVGTRFLSKGNIEMWGVVYCDDPRCQLSTWTVASEDKRHRTRKRTSERTTGAL